MKKSVNIILLVFFVVFIQSLQAQKQIGLLSITKTGSLQSLDDRAFYDADAKVGFGILLRKQFESKKFSSSTLSFQELGVVTQNEIPYDMQNAYFVYWKANSINASIEGGYYFLKNKKIEWGASVAFRLAILFNQMETISAKAPTEFRRFNKDFLPTIDLNMELNYFLTENIKLILRPNYDIFLYLRPDDSLVNYTSRNTGLDLGFLYVLNDEKNN